MEPAPAPIPVPTPAPTLALTFDAIGTAWSVEVYEPMPPAQAKALTRAIHERIAEFDQHYSRFRPDSLVAAMATTAGTYALPTDAPPLFNLYRELYDRTGGALTPLIGQTLSDAGYDANYSLQSRPLTSPPAWDDILTYNPGVPDDPTGAADPANLTTPTLTLATPALLDVGAAGKGYLVDIVAGLIESRGLTAYCVDAGGDLRYRAPGGPPLRVGLEHPADPSQVIGVAELSGLGFGPHTAVSLCGSAGNRRAWGDYHHIISPHTLSSPRHLQAVWVVAGTTLLADALTTALFLVESAALTSYYDFEYALVRSDNSLEHSPKFPAAFFAS